jgi:hypothetical protein
MSALDVVSARLRVHGSLLDRGKARCPAHDDGKASLSISQGREGVVMHCHAGCSNDSILAALNMSKADLFDTSLETKRTDKPRIVATYPYLDENRTLLFEAVRFEPKDFRQRRPDGAVWAYNLGDVRRVLYRLPEVRQAIGSNNRVRVVVAEGEKDVDALVDAGKIATCSPMGAGKWRAEYVDQLEGCALVTVIADRDTPGYPHARTIRDSLRSAGKSVSVVHAIIGKDAHDVLVTHKLAYGEAFERIDDRLDSLCEPTSTRPICEPTVSDHHEQSPGTDRNDAPEVESGWPELQPSTLRGLAGDIVAAIRPHTEADDAALLITTLTMFGAVVGATPSLKVEAAKHPARLFAIIVGDTAKGRKSTAIRQVRSIVEFADPEFFSHRQQSGFGSGESLADAIQGPERDTTDDRSNDANRVGDHRLLVVEQEFARILNSCGREGSILSAILRELWDGDRVQVRSRSKTVVVEDGAVCAIAAITKEELKRLLTASDTANGFANRFLFVLAKRARILPDGGTVPDEQVRNLGLRVAAAAKLARSRESIGRTELGRKRWAELYHEMADDTPDGMVGALTARAEPQVLRLALVYALLDSATEIDVEHFDAAYALWQYCRASVAHIFGGASGDQTADRVLAIIRDAGTKGISRTDLSKALSGKVSSPELGRVLKMFATNGTIETQDIQTEGRAKTIVRVAKKAEKAKEAPLNSLNSLNSPPVSGEMTLNSLNSLNSPSVKDEVTL